MWARVCSVVYSGADEVLHAGEARVAHARKKRDGCFSLGTSFVLDPPKFCCVISKKSAPKLLSRNDMCWAPSKQQYFFENFEALTRRTMKDIRLKT